MKKTIIPLLVVTSALFLGPNILEAQPGPDPGPGQGYGPGRGMGPRHGGGPGYGRGRHRHGGILFGNPAILKEKFGLSDDQIQKVGKINLEFRKKFLELREKMAPIRIKLRRHLLEENVNMDQVRSILKEIAELQTEIRILKIRHRLEIEKIFTEKQRALLRQFRADMPERGPGDGFPCMNRM